jgi:hypothetical protein
MSAAFTVLTAPAELALTGHLLTSNHGLTFTPVHFGGTEWTLVADVTDGTWTLTADSNLAWYPGDTFDDEGSEPEFEAQIDCTTPEHIAAAAHNIITAPAHLRAYVAAVEGPNTTPVDDVTVLTYAEIKAIANGNPDAIRNA